MKPEFTCVTPIKQPDEIGNETHESRSDSISPKKKEFRILETFKLNNLKDNKSIKK